MACWPFTAAAEGLINKHRCRALAQHVHIRNLPSFSSPSKSNRQSSVRSISLRTSRLLPGRACTPYLYGLLYAVIAVVYCKNIGPTPNPSLPLAPPMSRISSFRRFRATPRTGKAYLSLTAFVCRRCPLGRHSGNFPPFHFHLPLFIQNESAVPGR